MEREKREGGKAAWRKREKKGVAAGRKREENEREREAAGDGGMVVLREREAADLREGEENENYFRD